jgi:DNA-binding GntR family transcriptional regulator
MAGQVETEPAPLPDSLFLDLDRTSPIPLYFQMASSIEQAILDGRLAPGARLENELALGERLKLSRPTVRRALQELVDKGLLVRRRGIGTRVVQGPVRRKVELTSLYEDLNRGGRQPSTAVLSREVVPADARLAERLAVPAGSPVLHLRRLRRSGETPLAILENFLPEEFTGLSSEALTQHGLYQLIRGRGTAIGVAEQRIGARAATTAESRLLAIAPHGPVLTMDRTAYDSSGRVVEFGHHCYRPDLYSFEITLVDS